MIAAFRRFLAGYLPALAPICLAAVLAASPWTMEHSAWRVASQLITFLMTCGFILMLSRPAASQRLACFDWQTELRGLRQESIARAEMMQRLSESLGSAHPEQPPEKT